MAPGEEAQASVTPPPPAQPLPQTIPAAPKPRPSTPRTPTVPTPSAAPEVLQPVVASDDPYKLKGERILTIQQLVPPELRQAFTPESMAATARLRKQGDGQEHTASSADDLYNRRLESEYYTTPIGNPLAVSPVALEIATGKSGIVQVAV